MSAARSRFSGFGSSRRKGKAAGAVIACAVMLLAGCGSGGSSAEAGAPVIRGDAPVAAATLTVSNTTMTGTVGTPITLTSAGGSATDKVSFTTTTTGCTAIDASLSATTAGPCIVTATQVTQTSPAVTFTFTASAVANAATSSVKTLVFNSNGGDGRMADQGEVAPTALRLNSFTLSGFAFDGWATTPTGPKAYADGAVYPFPANAILYARWAGVVTFDPNGGSGSIAPQSAATATTLTPNANAITRSGYRFDGWATTPTGSKAFSDGQSFPFPTSATLYSLWSCLPLSGNRTVTITKSSRSGQDSARVTFTASSSESPWNTFTARSIGYGESGSTSTVGTITVRGLQRHTGYSFTVTGTNDAGCSYTSFPVHVDKFD